MDWLGIGVFILSIGFAIGVVFLIPVLKNLEKTLGETAETISKTQKSIEELTGETKLVLYNTNETILDVNNKLGKLDPLFQIVHDTGESAHHLTSSLARITSGKSESFKTGIDVLDRNQLHGFMRGAAFLYYLKQAKKEMNKQTKE
ncbi:DUF948 domain-containing protein [Evansella tamaricis]|uniref:DUF948 domain-containing protein n=1 Tax=Evansella tamaricis TaxID=2069301 RepID=A0ABS6JKA9_9BACI|nr:DUF948 domain-containing protein [Evansella tamaricis]MBU9713634.1 DUF948 domain-containing protein [Evansella tamaricis]